MTIAYGWKCPQCNTVHAPSQIICTKCAPPEVKTAAASGTSTYMGTMSIGWGGYSGVLGFGTVFLNPSPPPLTYREQRADKAIADWRGGAGSWKELRTLIVRAADEIVEHECEGCEDDDE